MRDTIVRRASVGRRLPLGNPLIAIGHFAECGFVNEAVQQRLIRRQSRVVQLKSAQPGGVKGVESKEERHRHLKTSAGSFFRRVAIQRLESRPREEKGERESVLAIDVDTVQYRRV